MTNKFKSYSFCTYPVLQDILDIILYNKGNFSNYFLSNLLKMYFKTFLYFFLKHKIQNNCIKTIFWQLHTWVWVYRRIKLALKFSILITVKASKCDHFGTEESWSHFPNENNIWINSKKKSVVGPLPNRSHKLIENITSDHIKWLRLYLNYI